jgi:hypothetical protein
VATLRLRASSLALADICAGPSAGWRRLILLADSCESEASPCRSAAGPVPPPTSEYAPSALLRPRIAPVPRRASETVLTLRAAPGRPPRSHPIPGALSCPRIWHALMAMSDSAMPQVSARRVTASDRGPPLADRPTSCPGPGSVSILVAGSLSTARHPESQALSSRGAAPPSPRGTRSAP